MQRKTKGLSTVAIQVILLALFACQYSEDENQNLALLMLMGGPASGSSGGASASSNPNECTSLCINEIGFSSVSNDFVEIYNPSTAVVDLSATSIHLQVDSACNPGNGMDSNLALSGSVASGAYFVIANSGHSLLKVNQVNLPNIASGYCFALARSSSAVSGPSDSNVVDWVTVDGAGMAENSSRATFPGADAATSRFPNATDTNTNASDFTAKNATVGSNNGSSLAAVKINELGVYTPLATLPLRNNDFVELYNGGTSSIDLAAAGAHIQRDPNCTLPGITDTIALTGTIPASGYYILAKTSHSLLNVDQTATFSIDDDDCIVLTSNSTAITATTDANVVDWVTVGAGIVKENAVSAPSTGSSGDGNVLSRCPNGTDTNNNANDFKFKPVSTGATNNCSLIHITELSAGQIVISEVLQDVDTTTGAEGGGAPNCTEANDEFVELYNTTGNTVYLMGASIQRFTNTPAFGTKYSFSEGTSISAGGRLAVVAADADCYTTAALNGRSILFKGSGWTIAGTNSITLSKSSANLTPSAPGFVETDAVDILGLGTSAIFETAAFNPAACVDISIVRTTVTSDANNNSTEFSCGTANGTPGN